MRSIIVNSNEFSDEEKVKKLQELAGYEMNAKRNCSEMIMDNRENVAKITMEVVKGLLTCGLSFAPAIVKRMKVALSEKSELLEFEDFQSVVDVDVTSEDE